VIDILTKIEIDREWLAIRAVVQASQQAEREATLVEVAALQRSLRWYEGGIAAEQREQARAMPASNWRGMERWR
jgi:hypothetical protein